MYILKLYMISFSLFIWFILPNVLRSIAKKNFFDSDFPLPVFWYTKNMKFYFRWGAKLQGQKQETGNDCEVISGLQASQKTDFSDIFLHVFSYKWRTFVPFLGELISSQ